MTCPASAVLTPGRDMRSPRAIAAAEWGTAAHYFKQHGKAPKGWGGNELFMERMSYMNRKHWWPSGAGEHEVTCALNVDTWTLEVYDGPEDGASAWKDSRDDACVTGTVDWIGRDWNERLTVDDLKTGTYVPDPTKAQFLCYATFASLRHDEPVEELSATHFPRYPKTSAPVRYYVPRGYDISALLAIFKEELRATYAEVKRLKRRLPVIKEDVKPDPDACHFCPAKEPCLAL